MKHEPGWIWEVKNRDVWDHNWMSVLKSPKAPHESQLFAGTVSTFTPKICFWSDVS